MKRKSIAKYVGKPVIAKKKDGESNFLQMLQYLAQDLAVFKDDVEYAILYSAIVINMYMHNSTHRPAVGYGKVQKREISHPLYYYRSQTRHPNRQIYDSFSKEKKKDKPNLSCLPRNPSYVEWIDETHLSQQLSNGLSKYDERGFYKPQDKYDLILLEISDEEKIEVKKIEALIEENEALEKKPIIIKRRHYEFSIYGLSAETGKWQLTHELRLEDHQLNYEDLYPIKKIELTNKSFAKILSKDHLTEEVFLEIKTKKGHIEICKPEPYFGVLLAGSGARTNNIEIYIQSLTSITNEEKENDEKIKLLRNKLINNKNFYKIKKITDTTTEFTEDDIKSIIKDFEKLENEIKKYEISKEKNLHSYILLEKTNRAKKLYSQSKQLKLKYLSIRKCSDSTCIFVELYPGFSNLNRQKKNIKMTSQTS